MSDPAGEIFVVRGNDELVALTSQPFPLEQDFQELLVRHPQLLAAGAGGRPLLLVRREAPIRHGEDGATGWLDHLFVDADGVLTLVEVKRSSDSRIRREVVGQMLDYASNAAFGWTVDMLRTYLADTHANAEAELARLLEDRDPETFWADVKTNLQAGKLRLLFVADVIPSDLRRIIEFMNRHMDPVEVLGVEIRQFVGEGVTTLLPKVIGQTEEATGRKTPRPSVKWTEQSFFEQLHRNATSEDAMKARRLLEWATRCSWVWWGEGTTEGSFVPTELLSGVKHQVCAVYSGNEKLAPCLYLYFQHYKAPFDSGERRMELLARFNAIDGIDLPPETINKRPRINLAELSNESLEQVLKVFDWYLAEVGAAGKPTETR